MPILPILEMGPICTSPRADVPSVLDVGSPVHVARGSIAMLLALKRIGLQPGDEVLIPAFHCPSMVHPVLAAQGNPAFYAISPDLGVSLEHIEPHLGPQTRAVLVPHLFGRIQRLGQIRGLCDSVQVTLIEDCAHALFGTADGRPVGSTGHFAIASPRKFLPLEEGGLLTSAVDILRDLPVRTPSAGRALRLAFDGVDKAIQYDRLRALRPLVAAVKGIRRGLRGASHESALPEHVEHVEAVPQLDAFRAAGLTRNIMRRLMTQELVRRRRENFSTLAAGLSDLPLLRPLKVRADLNSVPYMLPVILEQPERQFNELKARGMPMWRWEHSRRGVCRITDHYARALLQIPCHQSLRPAEIAWMIDVLRQVGKGTT